MDDLRTTARVMSLLVLAAMCTLYALVLVVAVFDRHGQPWTSWIILIRPYRYWMSGVGLIAALYLMMSNGRTGRKWPAR